MKRFFYVALTLFVLGNNNAQISIVNAVLNEYNISTNSLSQVSINNTGGQSSIEIESFISNSTGEKLVLFSSQAVVLKSGMNVLGAHNTKTKSLIYSTSPQGNYIKNFHRLASGSYNYCVTIKILSGAEEGDEYCQTIESNNNDQLYLVSPSDKEVISTTTPLLMWMHTEAFNLLSPGDFFRLTLVELKKKQSADEGVVSNVPLFVSNYVTKHQVQYPFDAEKLERGKKYGWIVQKISNGNIVASTEAWEFSIADNKVNKNHMYVDLKKKLDGTLYKVSNDKIYFKYNERYQAKELNCNVYSDTREKMIITNTSNEQSDKEGAKLVGYNSFELDLEPYDLKSGFYTLEVLDEKQQKYFLKFYID